MNELPFMFTVGAWIALAMVLSLVAAVLYSSLDAFTVVIAALLLAAFILHGLMRELPIEERWHSEPVDAGQPAPPDCRHLYDAGKHCEWRACILTPCR